MKDKIICLVGASGSGKTTLAKELEKQGYNIIQSYTTRKPREENEWGHTFIDSVIKNNGIYIETSTRRYYKDFMIAYFNDYDKGEHYFATKEQYQRKGTSVYIVDPKGAEQVHENVKDVEVVTIFLNAYWETCRTRMFTDTRRTPKQTIERVDRDVIMFEVVKCDYSVDANRETKEVLKDVVKIIENK